MNRVIFQEKIDSSFGNSLVRYKTDESYLPAEIFGLLKLKDYLSFLSSVAEESYFQFSEIGGFQFGPLEGSPFDGIEALKANEVEIGLGEESVRLPNTEFFQLSSDFGHKVIEAIVWFDLENQDIIDKEWRENIKTLVKNIDGKIECLPS